MSDSGAMEKADVFKGKDDGVVAAGKTEKSRMPQDMVDFILAWDVSDYVSATPENVDHLPLPDEYKARYRAERKESVAVMQESRRTKRKMQEFVKAELEKHGYVEIEKHQLEEYIANGGKTA